MAQATGLHNGLLIIGAISSFCVGSD